MLSEDKIIAMYCMVDDLLKGIGHKEDSRRKEQKGYGIDWNSYTRPNMGVG